LHRITFVVDRFKGPVELGLSHRALQQMLECLADIDLDFLLAHPETPLLYDSGVVYQEEPPGAEDWQDTPTCLKLGWGDCLPLETKVVLAESHRLVTVGSLKNGDVILGDKGLPTTILAGCMTGNKPILRLDLENGKSLRVSLNHHLFIRDDHAQERKIDATDVRPGDQLLSLESRARVVSIANEPDAVCGDVTTDTGRLYLPESDVVVSNCEDLACWRVAELRLVGVDARPAFTCDVLPDGSYLYHIQVELPNGTLEDPSRMLGMR